MPAGRASRRWAAGRRLRAISILIVARACTKFVPRPGCTCTPRILDTLSRRHLFSACRPRSEEVLGSATLGRPSRSCSAGQKRPRASGVRELPEVDVRLVDVVKKFGDQVAVDRINLEVRDGEFFSLLGPSGCGKTTTLRMIGGFEQPTSGLIELQGQDVTWLPPFKRNVNTVFQNYALFPHLTIFENVAFGLRRKGAKDSEVKSRAKEILALVELPGYEARKPTQISGGQ